MAMKAKCPLCGTEANCLVLLKGYVAADHRYDCARCSVFEIDAATREFLEDQDAQTHRTLAQVAHSAPEGKMYRFRAPTDAERQSQTPTTLIVQDLVRREGVE